MGNYLLIDFENVPDPDLTSVTEATQVWIFVGATQKVSAPVIGGLFALKGAFRKLTAARQGKNAVDFQLVFYLGQILAADPRATCRILSRDGDYDVLLSHLRGQGYAVSRVAPASALDRSEADAHRFLERTPSSARPKTRNSLANMLRNGLKRQWATSENPQEKVEQVIRYLLARGAIRITEDKVSYHFQAQSADASLRPKPWQTSSLPEPAFCTE